jgi:hypothetical protein
MKIKSMFAALAAGAIAVSALAVSAFAIPIANHNSDDGDKYVYSVKDNLPEGCKLSDVFGAKVVISGVNQETGAGGGFVFNSNTANWSQKEWGNEGSNKPIIYNYTDFTMTRLETESPFADTDEYAQVCIAQWDNWGDAVTVDSVTLLDKDGNELTAKAAETTTEAPADTTAAAATTTSAKAGAAVTTTKAADTKKADSAKTGDAGVGVAVAALGLAAAAAFTARKKH